MDYVILAGGAGRRFANQNSKVPKPMAPILGRPMIGVLAETLMKCGAGRIRVGANQRMPQLIEFLLQLKLSGVPLEIVPVCSDNSFLTLDAASKGLSGKFIALTCDAVFPIEEFKAYVEAFKQDSSGAALMGLTRFIDDDSPLYAKISDSGEIVDYRYGSRPFEEGKIVSAGIYGLSAEIMNDLSKRGIHPDSLSDFQRSLALDPSVRVLPYEFSVAFDVDTPGVLRQAEAFLSTRN